MARIFITGSVDGLGRRSAYWPGRCRVSSCPAYRTPAVARKAKKLSPGISRETSTFA